MINDILISYFKENSFVVIPRKGILIKATDNNEGKEQVAFIYNPTVDYSDFLAYTQITLEVDESAANTIIEGFCALMDSHLKNKGEYQIKDIATLCTDHKWGIYIKQNITIPKIATSSVTEQIEDTTNKRLEEVISEKATTEKKLDTILSEPHQRKIEVVAPVTFADKYKKTNETTISEEIVENTELPVETFTEEPKEVIENKKEEERRDKLNEIFASKRVNDSSNEFSDKLNELYKKPNNTPTTSAPTPTPISTPTPVVEEPLTGEPNVEEYVVPKKKKIDGTMIFLITSIVLFLCALGYYFTVKSDIDFDLPNGQDSLQTEQIEVIE